MAAGVEGMSPEQLIAVVLGTRSTGLARALLDHCGDLGDLARASPRELTAVAGVGEARAARLSAAFQLGRCALAPPAVGGGPLSGAADAFARLQPRFAGVRQELFIAFALDVRNTVLAEIEVARGCLTGVEVHPREVFRPLIRVSAAAVIVAHNHPSGDPRPSPEDLALTDRLRKVGELVGIPVLDHVIVAGPEYISMAERLWQ